MPQSIKYTIQLPDHYERKLRLWAKFKGQSRAGLSANIIQARIEANWPEIQRDMEAIAKRQGIALEDLESQWLDESDDE